MISNFWKLLNRFFQMYMVLFKSKQWYQVQIDHNTKSLKLVQICLFPCLFMFEEQPSSKALLAPCHSQPLNTQGTAHLQRNVDSLRLRAPLRFKQAQPHLQGFGPLVSRNHGPARSRNTVKTRNIWFTSNLNYLHWSSRFRVGKIRWYIPSFCLLFAS